MTVAEGQGEGGGPPRRRRRRRGDRNRLARTVLSASAAVSASLLWIGHRHHLRTFSELHVELLGRTSGGGGGPIASRLDEFKAKKKERIDVAPQSPSSSGPPPYELSPLCPGCRHAPFRPGKQRGPTCGERAEQLRRGFGNASLSFAEAHRTAAREAAEWGGCRMCARDAPCPGKGGSTSGGTGAESKYWRFDAAAPRILRGATHFLPSIPASWRVPPSAFGNVTRHLRAAWESNRTAPGLAEFNPTLIRLTPAMTAKLRADRFDAEPVYLASYRVSTETACFDHGLYGTLEEEQTEEMKLHQNYLGLALLDADLALIGGSDVVVDLETHLMLREDRKMGIGKHLVDFRLFAFGDAVYLNMNGPPVFVVPIELRAPTMPDSPPPNVTQETIDNADEGGGGIRFPNMFGTGMELVLGHDLNTIWGDLNGGKNFALFRGDSVDDGATPYAPDEVYAEVLLFGPRIVQRVRLEHIPRPLSLLEVAMKLWPNNPMRGLQSLKKYRQFRVERREVLTENATLSSTTEEGGGDGDDDAVPAPSFATVEELWFPSPILAGQPRGGACCVRIDGRHTSQIPASASRPSGRGEGALLVGVGHTKIPYRPWMARAPADKLADMPHHQYFSYLYAFDSRPPFRIVARSGLFCFGYPGAVEGAGNPHARHLVRRRRLSLKRREFDCPEIQFVSGIAEEAGDGEGLRAIVSYGINDCTPRMVVVEKRELARLLFGPPAL